MWLGSQTTPTRPVHLQHTTMMHHHHQPEHERVDAPRLLRHTRHYAAKAGASPESIQQMLDMLQSPLGQAIIQLVCVYVVSRARLSLRASASLALHGCRRRGGVRWCQAGVVWLRECHISFTPLSVSASVPAFTQLGGGASGDNPAPPTSDDNASTSTSSSLDVCALPNADLYKVHMQAMYAQFMTGE